MVKKLFCLALSLLIVCALFLPVFATQEEEVLPQEVVYENTITIDSLDEFLSFAERCKLDSYSQSLAVTLTCDMDLSDTDFTGVPIFCGSFDGDGHTISGLNLTHDGSAVGLFRYLTDTAIVKNLTVSGSVLPEGSRDIVGGIAGENAGLIENCVFSGTVSGSDKVGAIAGINKVTGIIDDCQTKGLVHGDHFVGGICGENMGVIRGSINSAPVNITPQQNSVELSDITMESLTNSESASTVTDVGGIAGTSGGVIRDCDNFAAVGYRQMGYNIGGIVGSQMGYIVDCQNFGEISGRKEVGGIVGQMEPVTSIVYTTDTLQILQSQLDAMGALAGRASANAQSSANAITGQIGVMQDSAQTAKDAVTALLPGNGIPDTDSMQAAQNALNSSFSTMQSSLQSISSTAQTAAATLSSDMQALTGQIAAMGATIKEAPENLGGTITDISDNDTPENTTGKAENCTNYGAVLADLNAGGIAGAINLENDLDPDEDVEITGETSLNFDSELRAVILDCENTATITVTKQNGGGIAGRMALGLTKNCLNAGTLDSASANYVGGVAGQSTGYIRQSHANCILSGNTYVGGIAGTANAVTDCRSMVQLTAAEKSGAVLGFAESREEISGNFYFTLETDPGAIDGISYEGCAQGLDKATFLALEELPSIFHRITVTFAFADGTEEKRIVTPGDSLKLTDIPELPEVEGHTAAWEGLDSLDVYFDTVFHAQYTPYPSVMESEDSRKDGRPILLTEGSFLPEGSITVTETPAAPALGKRQKLVDCLGVSLPESLVPVTVRYLPENDMTADTVLALDASGTWQEVSFRLDGSYLVFDAPDGCAGIALIQNERPPVLYLAAAAAVVVILAVVALIIRAKKRSKK